MNLILIHIDHLDSHTESYLGLNDIDAYLGFDGIRPRTHRLFSIHHLWKIPHKQINKTISP
jgi:hypothetical protein